MNGQVPPPFPPAVAPERQRAPWSTDPEWEPLRLMLALALSCLLHAAVVFLPFLGESAKETRLALKGRQKVPHVLNATLSFVGENRFSAESVPPAAEIVPEAPPVEQPGAEEQFQARPGAEGADLLPIPALPYYRTDQLTKRPQPIAAVDLDPPEIAPIVVSGKIVLRIWINEFGSVSDVEVEKTELPEMFARAAVAAFKNLRFAPGERNGRPVGTVMRIEVTYDDGRMPAP
jgi:TonB family protein